MRYKIALFILFLTTVTSYAQCARTSFYCLDPEGRQFGGIVTVQMWYNRIYDSCIASPHSRLDGCIQVTLMCNAQYQERCHNDCLAGDSVSQMEKTCVGVVPISPPTTVPNFDTMRF